MASGSFTFSTNNKYITGRIRWSSTSNGSAANSSKVTAYLDFKKSSSSSAATYGTFSGYININGSQKSLSMSLTLSTNDTWINVGSYTVTVNHNNDGTKSIYIIADGGISGTTFSMDAYTKSGLVLDKIPRYATIKTWTNTAQTQTSITLQVTTDVTCSKYEYQIGNESYVTASGSTFTVDGLVPDSSYTLRCRVTRSDSGLTTESAFITVATDPIATLEGPFDFNIGEDLPISIINSDKNASTITVYTQETQDSSPVELLTVTSDISVSSFFLPLSTVADELYQLCTSTNSIPITITCGITLDNTFHSHSYTGTASVINSNPLFEDFNYGNTDTTTQAILENPFYLIQTFGNMQVQITDTHMAMGQNYARITGYHISVVDSGNTTFFSSVYETSDGILTADLGSFSESGDYNIQIYAIDSRGNISPTITKSFYILPYHFPSATINLKRYNEFEKEVLIELSSLYSKLMLNGSIKNNAFGIKYRFTELGAEMPDEYISLQDLTFDMSVSDIDVMATYSNTSPETPFQILDSAKAYRFEFILEDRLFSVVKVIDVAEGIPIMIETDNGMVAVGMIPEMKVPAKFQVATDILATDSEGKQRLVLEDIDAKNLALQEQIQEINRKLSHTVKGCFHKRALTTGYTIVTKEELGIPDDAEITFINITNIYFSDDSTAVLINYTTQISADGFILYARYNSNGTTGMPSVVSFYYSVDYET